jgi:uncharacterized membrane protein YidH (DUF202 family)
MAETQTFSTIPILPLSHALDSATKPKFLEDLRHALLNVGFLYLSETGLPEQLVRDVIGECQNFFQKLPQEEKERIEMKNEKSFLGWSRVSRRLLNVWFVSICLCCVRVLLDNCFEKGCSHFEESLLLRTIAMQSYTVLNGTLEMQVLLQVKEMEHDAPPNTSKSNRVSPMF